MDEIYTHDEASRIIDLFEDILDHYNIRIPSPEDDDRDPDSASIYGSVYSELLDNIEDRLVYILERYDYGARIITDVYSGKE